jgi:hypothetical protein
MVLFRLRGTAMVAMPSYAEILSEIGGYAHPTDVVRRKYLAELQVHTGRNVICYYSGWLQRAGSHHLGVIDTDKNAFMACIHSWLG